MKLFLDHREKIVHGKLGCAIKNYYNKTEELERVTDDKGKVPDDYDLCNVCRPSRPE